MKKHLTIVLIMVLAMCAIFSSCSYRGKFFDKKHLEEHLVDNLPKVKHKIVKDYGSKIYVSMTEKEFEKYVISVYEYILSCDFERLGTRGEIKSGLIGIDYYVDTNVSQLGDFHFVETYESGSYSTYIFVWANEIKQCNYSSSTYTKWETHYLELSYLSGQKQMAMEMCHPISPYTFVE